MSIDLWRKYNENTTLRVELYGPSGDETVTGLSFVAGDVTYSIDGAAFQNGPTPTEIGATGIYEIALVGGTHLLGKHVLVRVSDQTSPALWLQETFQIDTYGNASAQHAFDLGSGTVANVTNVATVATVSGNVTANDVTLASGTHDATISNVTTVGSVTALTTADVLAQIRTAFQTDTIPELTGPLPAAPTVFEALSWMGMLSKAGGLSTESTIKIKNDAGTVIATAVVTDDGVTFTKGKFS